MATDLEKLVVSLSADIKSYERGLAKATNVTTFQLRKIEKEAAGSMSRVENSFAKAGNAIAGFGKGLVIGGILAAVAGLEQLVEGSITSAAAIGDLSEKLGITSDKLQELQYGAVQANMGFDELETSMLKFSKSLGQARNGQGDLLKRLEANGFDKAKIKALSYSEALDVVADLVKNAANEQDALLIITQAFGKGGDEMLEFLRNGSAGLNGFAVDAHNAGAIIDAELIKSAQAFDDAWSASLLSIKSKLGDFVLSALPLIQKFDKMTSDAADNLGLMLGTLTPESIAARIPAQIPMAQSGARGPVTNPETAKVDAATFVQAQKDKSDAIKRLIDFSIEQQHRAADAAEEQLKLDRELYDSKLELAQTTFDAFEAIAIGGEKASDVIKDLAKNLLKAAIQASLFGSGPFANLFGTSAGGGIFGSLFGKRAGGGHVNAGQPYVVGERRAEVFVPSQSGSIVPKVGGGSGSNVTIVDQRKNAPAIQQQNGSGGNLMLFIRDAVVDTVGGGHADRSMIGRFGLPPNKVRR